MTGLSYTGQVSNITYTFTLHFLLNGEDFNIRFNYVNGLLVTHSTVDRPAGTQYFLDNTEENEFVIKYADEFYKELISK